MFEAKLDDISYLRDSMGAIAELIDEATLHLGSDGIKMTSADRTVVVVIDFFLSKNVFKEYECTNEKKIGINLMNFIQILKRSGASDKATLKLLDNKIEIMFEGTTKRVFSLPLIDISRNEVPNLEKIQEGFTANFEIDNNALGSGVDDAELVGDSVVLTVRKDAFILKSESDSSSTQLEMSPGPQLKINEINEPIRARYSLDYLKKIMKARKLSEKSKIFMATDYPIRMVFEVPEKLHLGFVLAPRVEEN